jgi:PAS domain-containing protein
VIDTTPALIHTGRPDGYLDYFNRSWREYTGKSLGELCGWRWTDSVHPEDVAGIIQKWQTSLESGELFEAEARVRLALLPLLSANRCEVATNSRFSKML